MYLFTNTLFSVFFTLNNSQIGVVLSAASRPSGPPVGDPAAGSGVPEFKIPHPLTAKAIVNATVVLKVFAVIIACTHIGLGQPT